MLWRATLRVRANIVGRGATFRRAVLPLCAVCALAATSAAQSQIRIDERGPGVGSSILERALRRPHTIVRPDSGRYTVARAATVNQSLVVLGRDVAIEGHVQGDVIVIDGNLYMHPGGAIDGRALAFGGGVYGTPLGSIGGEQRAFRNFTYDISPVADGWALRYRSLIVQDEAGWSFPGVYGIREPEYNRSDGLSIGLSPRYIPPGTRFVFVPRATYRSQLGQVDPSLEVQYAITTATTLDAIVERATLSNDRWIRGNLVNSGGFLWNGTDARNYWRANYAQLRATHAREGEHGMFAPYVALKASRDRSVRPDAIALGGPWVFRDRNDDDRLDRLRPNPPINRGDLYSVLSGAAWNWSDDAGVRARVDIDGELGALDMTSRGRPFTTGFGQGTIDGRVEFPTFGKQSLSFRAHVVGTASGRTPAQRYAYLGGSGTISTLDLLSLAGNQLLFLDSRYRIPLPVHELPYVGVPALSLRQVMGGAALNAFPTIHQAIGARLGVRGAYVEWLIDPDTRRTHFSAGVGRR